LARRRRFTPKVEPLKNKFRVNRSITLPKIRLVGDDMEAISEAAGKTITPDVYDTREVLRWAQEMEMDLVEISPKADPPVCKITDFNRNQIWTKHR